MNTMKRLRLQASFNSPGASLTQCDVAKAIGVKGAAVSKWERGKSKPTADKLLAIAKLYGCTVTDLLADDTYSGDGPDK